MKPNPFSSLLHSRKFWLMVWDFIVSIVLYFGAKYAGASAFEDVKFLIGALQLPIVAIIMAIATEDAATTKAGLDQSGQYPAVK